MPGALRAARRGCAAALLASSALPSRARAQGAPPRTASLSWAKPSGAEACFSTRALARTVDERLGRHVIVSASEADLSVEASVERVAEPPGWRATVVLRNADGTSIGTRELASAGNACDSLRAPLAIVIAVMIDPEAALSPRKPPAAPAPPPKPSEPPPPCPAPAPTAEPWSVTAWAGAGAAVGVLPAVAVGPSAGVLIKPPHLWGFEAFANWWAPQTRAAEQGADVTFRLASGGIAICPLTSTTKGAAFAGCVGGALGSLRADPSHFDLESNHEQPVVEVTVRGRAVLPIAGPLAASVGASVAAPLRRDDVRYQPPLGGPVSLFRLSPLALGADVALGVRFP